MTTLARPRTSESSHWYFPDGRPCHTVKCSTRDGERPTTIADARKLGLYPSVTNILRVLHKIDLEAWKKEQFGLALLTAPRGTTEGLDDFVKRVVHEEKQHEQEAKTASSLGIDIHEGLCDELSGRHCKHEVLPYIEPVWDYLNSLNMKARDVETVLVGDGYAGRVDLILSGDNEIVVDFKTTKKLPAKGAYWEHRMQTAAYAAASLLPAHVLRTMNIYISTTELGQFVVAEQPDWEEAFRAFACLRDYWQIANDYKP